MTRNHIWDKDDTIINLYYVKYGIQGLPVKDVKDLAENVIGSTISSLDMQSANIRFVLGEDVGVLDCYSKTQENVVNEYNVDSKEDLKNIVINIINKRDIEENIKISKQRKIEKERKIKEKQKQLELEELFRKMGKDPKKMKKIS